MKEIVLVESASLRKQFCTDENTVVLDKVGQLITLPDSGYATKDSVMKFFDIKASTHVIEKS